MFRFRKAKKSLHKKSTPFMIYYRLPSSRIIFPYFWLQIHPFPSDKMLKISYFLTQVENDFFFPDKTQQIFTVKNVDIIYDYLEDQRLLGPARKFF